MRKTFGSLSSWVDGVEAVFWPDWKAIQSLGCGNELAILNRALGATWACRALRPTRSPHFCPRNEAALCFQNARAGNGLLSDERVDIFPISRPIMGIEPAELSFSERNLARCEMGLAMASNRLSPRRC